MSSPASAAAPEAAGVRTPQEGPQRRHLVLAVIAVSLAVVLSVIDGSVANVALPSISRDLAASPQASVWIVNGYQLAIIATLLPFAALGERISYHRVFTSGVIVFTLSSLACTLAGSLGALVAARVGQGLGASAIMCCSSALLRHIYPAASFGKGLARNTLIVTISAAAGPSISGAVLSVASWPWLFAINLPVGVAALYASRYLPATPRQDRTFDTLSIALNALGMCLGVIALDLLAHSTRLALALIIVAALCIWLLVRRSRSLDVPLLPLDLFRIQRFRWAVSASFCMFAAQMCAFVALPFHLQQAMGRSAVQTGLLMTAWPIGASLTNLVLSRYVDRIRAGTLCSIGATLLIVGLGFVAALPATVTDLWLVCGMLVSGIGLGFFQSPNSRDMLSATPRSRSGAAGGMQATARVNGQTWGAALAGLCFAMAVQHGALLAVMASIAFAAVALVLNLVRRKVVPPKPAVT